MTIPPASNRRRARSIGKQLLSPWSAEAARRTGCAMRGLGRAWRSAAMLSATGMTAPTIAS